MGNFPAAAEDPPSGAVHAVCRRLVHKCGVAGKDPVFLVSKSVHIAVIRRRGSETGRKRVDIKRGGVARAVVVTEERAGAVVHGIEIAVAVGRGDVGIFHGDAEAERAGPRVGGRGGDRARDRCRSREEAKLDRVPAARRRKNLRSGIDAVLRDNENDLAAHLNLQRRAHVRSKTIGAAVEVHLAPVDPSAVLCPDRRIAGRVVSAGRVAVGRAMRPRIDRGRSRIIHGIQRDRIELPAQQAGLPACRRFGMAGKDTCQGQEGPDVMHTLRVYHRSLLLQLLHKPPSGWA